MLRFWLCFLSFFYTVNSFSTEEEKLEKECEMCWEKKDSSTLIKSKEIFPCNNCTEDHLICKECILSIIMIKPNLGKEKELTENNEKIKVLELIFGYIKEEISSEQNNYLQDFVKGIINEEKNKEKNKEEKKDEEIKTGEEQNLNAEKELVYKTIYEKKDEQGNTIFYIGNEQDPTEKLKFIKSFLSLLKNFNEKFYPLFTRNIEWAIRHNCQQEMKIKEIEKWEEKDVETNLSVRLGTTELQKK